MKKILMIIMLLFGNYVSADSACCELNRCSEGTPDQIIGCTIGCGGCGPNCTPGASNFNECIASQGGGY